MPHVAQRVEATNNPLHGLEIPHNHVTPRSDLVTLTCPSCGGRLQITNDMDRFACGHCGNEHLVRREGGAVFLAPLAADIRQIRGGVDKTAAELAIHRLTSELKEATREPVSPLLANSAVGPPTVAVPNNR